MSRLPHAMDFLPSPPPPSRKLSEDREKRREERLGRAEEVGGEGSERPLKKEGKGEGGLEEWRENSSLKSRLELEMLEQEIVRDEELKERERGEREREEKERREREKGGKKKKEKKGEKGEKGEKEEGKGKEGEGLPPPPLPREPGFLNKYWSRRESMLTATKKPESKSRSCWTCLTGWWPGYDQSSFKYAIQLGVGIFFATFFSIFKSYLVGTGGVWVGISLIIVMEINVGPSFQKSVQRILGTIIGGGVGMAIITSIGHTGPDCFSCSYKPIALLLLLPLAIAFFSYFRSSVSRYSYVFTMAAISAVLVVDGEMPQNLLPSEVKVAKVYWMRMVGVMIGITLGFLITLLLFPNRASSRLRDKMVEVLRVDLHDLARDIIEVFVVDSVIHVHSKSNLEELHLSENFSDMDMVSVPMPFTEEDILDETTKMGVEHAHLMQSAKQFEKDIYKISNKLGECRDLLKLCNGEPVFKRRIVRISHYARFAVHYPSGRMLPQEELKRVILGIRALFNLLIPLVYLLNFDMGNTAAGNYDLMLDYYEKELEALAYQIESMFTSAAEYLKTGEQSDYDAAVNSLKFLNDAVRVLDQKRTQLQAIESRFPVSEVQAFYQIRIASHLMAGKAKALLEFIRAFYLKVQE